MPKIGRLFGRILFGENVEVFPPIPYKNSISKSRAYPARIIELSGSSVVTWSFISLWF